MTANQFMELYVRVDQDTGRAAWILDGTWHRESTPREALIKGVHAHLFQAQLRGRAEDYHRLLGLAWTLPLPMNILASWEEQFRPSPKPTTPQIPIPWRAPKQALKWGMDPELVAQAKARHRIVQAIENRTTQRMWTRSACYLLDDCHLRACTDDLFFACRTIRRHGLAEAFGLESK